MMMTIVMMMSIKASVTLAGKETKIILVIVLIIFGAGKLPKVAGELAKGIKSFKEGLKEDKKNNNEKK